MALVTEAIRTEVAQLYVALFGRAPLSEGLGFYSQKVASGMSIPQVAQEMFNLDVARSYYPLEATAEQVITSFFTNVLGRTPEAGGLSYWVGRLNAANALNPDTAEGTVIAEMIDSVVAYSGTNAVALNAQALFNKKVEVALAFRDAQVSNPEGGHPYGLSDAVLRDVSDDILKTVTATNVTNPDLFVDSFLNTYFGRTLTVSAQDATEGEGNVVFKLELSAAPALPITITVSTGAAGDTATKGSDYTAVSQQITFAAGQTVQYITVNVNDDALVEAAENVTLNVSGPANVTVTGDQVAQITSNDVANQAPVAQSAAIAAEEAGDVVNGAVLATDVDGDTLTYAVVGDVPEGLTFNANGTFSFNPKVGAYNSLAADATLIKTVTYAVSDGNGHTVNGTLTITITGTNDGPVAQAVIASGLEDAASIAITPVSADADSGDTAVYAVNTQPSNGTVSFNALTAKFDYTPKANFNGVDSFTYKVTDASGATSIATATVTVAAVNDAPVALGGAASAAEGGAIVYGTVTGSDVDEQTLSYAVNGDAPAGLTFNADGTFSFDPRDPAYDGLVAGEVRPITVDYTVSDNHPTDPKSDTTGVLTITLVGTNDAPTAQAVAVSGAEDATIVVPRKVADVDPTDTHTFSVALNPSNGTVSYNAVTGNFDYVPNADFNGIDTFTYRVTDNNGASATAVATVTVNPVNDDPVAEDVALLPGVTGRAYTFTEDRLLSRATDVDGDTLNVIEVRDSAGNLIEENVDAAGQKNGTWTFYPTLGDTEEVFAVKVSDGTTTDMLDATVVFGDSVFNLTSRRDVEQGYQVYNAQPEYTPGGDDLVNTLQDEDSLVGTNRTDDTLNALIGAPNDAGEVIITPVLRDIEIVNAEFTGGNGGALGNLVFLLSDWLGGTQGSPILLNNANGIDFQNAQGVEQVNVNRITDTNAYVVLLSLQDSTDQLSVSNATRNGVVEFNWAEGQLAGSETVTLTLDDVRIDELLLTAGEWDDWLDVFARNDLVDLIEDEGYGIEHLLVNVTGTTNLDEFTVFPNGAEPVAGPAMPVIDVVPPGALQIIEFTTNAGAALEINSLVMPGAEQIVIHAAAPVVFTGNERTNADNNDNNGLDRTDRTGNIGAFTLTTDLERIDIDGTADGDVWLNGVNSGSDGVHDVVIEGSEMRGNLAVRIEDWTAAASDSSVDSGWGNDEVVTTSDSDMAITTRDGDDHVHIGRFQSGDSNDVIRTGAGADRVEVMGTIRGDVDTWSAVATNVTGTDVGIDTAADGDSVWANASDGAGETADISSANIWTGEGDDTIRVDDAIINPTVPVEVPNGAGGVTVRDVLPSRVIEMDNGNDLLWVRGADSGSTVENGHTITTDISLAAGYAVEMGEGNDRATFAASTAGTISTSGGNDTVQVGDDVLEGANITSADGNDIVVVSDDVSATIDTGNGDDLVRTGNHSRVGDHIYDGDVEGPGRVLTGEGNDTVNVGGDLDVAYADYVGFSNHGPRSDDSITTETDYLEEEGETPWLTSGLNVPGTGKLQGQADKTTTVAARVETGNGNDVVNVDGVLYSAAQWNDNKIDVPAGDSDGDYNVDDTITIIGSRILLGDGDDKLTVGDHDNRSNWLDPSVVEEGALIDAGAGNDTVVINHNGPVVLAADNTEINQFGKSVAGKPGQTPAAAYDVYYSQREVAAGKAVYQQDTTGAMVYLGAGNDSILFNDVAFDVSADTDLNGDGIVDGDNRFAANSANTFSGPTVIVDRGAILDGDVNPNGVASAPATDTDTMTVRTVDDIDVVRSRVWHAIDTADSDSDTDSIVVGGINPGNANDATTVNGSEVIDAADGQGGFIRNIDEINLVIENTVTPFEENYGRKVGSEYSGPEASPSNDPAVKDYLATDDDSRGATIRIDEFQVNTDLERINLVSNEQRLLLEDTQALYSDAEAQLEDPYAVAGHQNGYIPGVANTFEIDAHRQNVSLTVKAYELTGVTSWSDGDFDQDGVLDGQAWPYEGFNPAKNEYVGEGFELRDDCVTDVTVSVNMDRYATDNNKGFTLQLLRNDELANQTGEENYDVKIVSEDEYATNTGNQLGLSNGTPTVVKTAEDNGGNPSGLKISAEGLDGVAINASDDDLTTDGLLIRQYAREITLNVDTGASHSIDLNQTFVGNKDFLGENTKLIVNVSDGLGEVIELDDVRADETTVTGAADLYLYMRNDGASGQPFRIDLSKTTGSNLIDMTGDGTSAPATFDDSVYGGEGSDLLLVRGGTDILGFFNGSKVPEPVIDGIEQLAIMFVEGVSDESTLVVDAAGDLNEILIVNTNRGEPGIDDKDDSVPSALANGDHIVNITATGAAVGKNALTINADIDISADLEPPFCDNNIKSTRHSDGLLIDVQTSGAAQTDLDLRVNVAEGTAIRLRNDANEFARVYATVSALANTYVNDNEDPLFNAGGDQEGELKLTVGAASLAGAGGIDEIYLVDDDNGTIDNFGSDRNGANFNNVFVKVENSWATNVNAGNAYDLKIDASDISDTNNGAPNTKWNAWNEFDGTAELDANLYIIGTQDRDDIDGGVNADTLDGQDGTDLLYGGLGNDLLIGGGSDDQLAGDYDGGKIADGGNDTLIGGDGRDLLYGGVKADILTGGKDNDFFVYTRRADSNSGYDDAGIDTITDFNANGELTDSVAGTDVIDVRYLAFDPAPIDGVVGSTSIGQFVTGKKMVFGLVDEVSSLLLGGNGKNFADAQSRTFKGNGVIEVAYQQDEGVLWFDLNDDGTLNNNDLRIHVPLPAGKTQFEAGWINGIYGANDTVAGVSKGDGSTDFFGAVHSDPALNKFQPYALGTVVSDHIIVDADRQVDKSSLIKGLQDNSWAASGALATYGGNDEVTVLDSNASDDIIIDLGDGNDRLLAGEGDESLYGGEGHDSIAAGNGNDWVFGGNGDDTVFGEGGADYIEATPGNDYLDGGADNDTIISTSGNDTIFGRGGDDRIISGDSKDYDWGDDLDYVEGGQGADFISTGSDADIVFGDDRNDTIGAGNDTILSGDGADSVLAGGGADTVDAGSGNDTVRGEAGNDSIHAGEGADWVDAGANDDTVLGLGGADTIYGDEGLDRLFGGADSDSIAGGAGNDIIDGDTGSDTLRGDDGEDSISGGDGVDYIYGGASDDEILGGLSDDVIDGGANDDSITGDQGADSILGGSGDDSVWGGTEADTIRGQDGNDQIWGQDGTDLISGGNANDSIWGGNDADVIDGDDGNDSIFGQSGSDTIDAGNGNDTASGGDDADWIHGRTGDDSLVGDGGNDTIYGGNPTESSDDSDTIRGGEGNDLAYGYDDADLIQGNTGSDTLYGGDENDSIGGGAGADVIAGEEQDDLIFGGWMPVSDGLAPVSMVGYVGNDSVWSFVDSVDGSDVLSGGIGSDTMFGGSSDDVLDGGADNDWLAGDWAIGEDAFEALGATGFGFSNSSNARFTDLYAGQDSIVGGTGLDTIQGGFGDDTIHGGGEGDLIFGEYVPTFGIQSRAGSRLQPLGLPRGEDLVSPAIVSDKQPAVPVQISNDDLIFGDAGNDTIFGDISEDANNFEAQVGIAGNDTIDGGDGADLIFGGGGNDSVFGGADTSGDMIYGGYGLDSIWGGGGSDLIYGWDGADYIDGGAQNDTIYGGEGADTISGGENDDYIGGGIEVSGGDSISGGSGNDTIYGDAGNDTIYGEADSDSIFGGVDNDWVDAGTQDDAVYGEGGNDSLFGGDQNDWLDGGADNDSLMGGADNDTLFGNDGADWLWGEGGNDSLIGGEGADSVFGGEGDDNVNLADADNAIDHLFLSRATTVAAPTTPANLTSVLGDDTISGFDTNDVDGSGAQGDLLHLLKSEVSHGVSGAVVTVTDWSNDAFFDTWTDSGSTLDPADWVRTYLDSTPFDTTGNSPSDISIANAALVIVKTSYEDGDDPRTVLNGRESNINVSQPGTLPGTAGSYTTYSAYGQYAEPNDGTGDDTVTGFGNDFEFDYRTADGVDAFLRAQNGSFNGSVFVLTDNAGEGDGASALVHLWWDASANDQLGGVGYGVTDTVLVGTFTSIEDAEAFVANIHWADSWPAA